jgi:beta-N-acetylhexosaminidase
VTLVKEEKGVLPFTPAKYKKILYMPIEAEQGIAYSVKSGVGQHFKEMLEREGFDVVQYVPSKGFESMAQRYGDIVDRYDAIVYLANMATKSNQTTVRIE